MLSFLNRIRMKMSRIVEVVHNTDSTVYRVSADSKQDEIIDVPKENVIAKCTTESISLGKVIKFFKGITGILVGMIFPCVILLAMLIFKIYSVRKRGNEEEDEMFYVQPEGEDVNNDSSGTSANPLFDPLTGVKPDISFEEKKSSIAENFSMKPAAKRNFSDNNNIQSENAVEKFRAAVDEKPSAPVTRRPSLAPEASRNDKNHKMAAIKAALNKKVDADDKIDLEKTAAFKIPAAQEKTGEPKSQPVRQQTVSQPIRKNPVQNKPVKKTVPKKQDNIHSIDDLIKALEEEKKKLYKTRRFYILKRNVCWQVFLIKLGWTVFRKKAWKMLSEYINLIIVIRKIPYAPKGLYEVFLGAPEKILPSELRFIVIMVRI